VEKDLKAARPEDGGENKESKAASHNDPAQNRRKPGGYVLTEVITNKDQVWQSVTENLE